MALRADLLPALAAFESAARHQNFTHAAEELHLTASAVSHHVRKLESRLGVSLFQRHARGVSLTAEGRQLADAASTALADMDGVVHKLRTQGDEQARIRVTTLHSLAYTWLIPRLPDFSQRHPDIRLNLDTEIALTRFDDGGPDLGIRHGPGHWPGLSAHHLMDDEMFPVASPGMRGFADIATPADLLGQRLIADHTRQGWLDWFRAADLRGARIDEYHTFSDTSDALSAAAHGLGVFLARQRIAAPYLASGRLARLPGPTLKARWSYYVVYPAHRRLRPAAATFVDWLLAQGQD